MEEPTKGLSECEIATGLPIAESILFGNAPAA
jgi:hypothetical protein